MIKVRTFRATAARDGFAVMVADDSTLVGVTANGSVVISRDPSETIAKMFSPVANSETDSAVIAFDAFQFTSVQLIFPVQLKQGEYLYLSTGSAGFCQLWFDTAEP
jgi:hypothetical protein